MTRVVLVVRVARRQHQRPDRQGTGGRCYYDRHAAPLDLIGAARA